MFKPELGVSLHDISRELTDEMIQAVGESEIATLEIMTALFSDERNIAQKPVLKDMLHQSGKKVMTIHARFGGDCDLSNLDEDASQVAVETAFASVDLAEYLDAPMIVLHASAEPIDPAQRGARLDQTTRSLEKIGQRCRKTGRRAAIELLPRTCLGNTVEELGEILARLDSDTFGVCLDTNHLMDRYRQLPDDIRKLGQRLITTHLSDYDGVDEKHQPPGNGVIDWPAVKQALGDIDYQGPFNYECHLPGDTPRERIKALEDNFRWLSSAQG